MGVQSPPQMREPSFQSQMKDDNWVAIVLQPLREFMIDLPTDF